MKKKLLFLASLFLAMCFSVNLFAQTSGTLTFSFTPIAHTSYSGTKSVLAVWIQNSTGTFVKTKIRNVGSGTKDHLPTWAVNAGGTASNATTTSCNTTDATTGATLTSFAAKSIIWDGKNVNGATNGTVVADGTYKVTIEETWNHGASGTAVRSFTFIKGTSADIQTPTSDANFTNISLNWTPTPNAVESVDGNSEVSIFPNPTNGIFNVTFKQATNITIENALGAVVYEEKIDPSCNAKNINLSNFAEGIYFINVINGEKSSKHKIILNK